MKKFLLAALMALPAFAFAAPEQKPFTAICDKEGLILKELRDTYQEFPVLAGKAGEKSIMTLVVNQQKGTWSLLVVTGDEICVLLTGVGVAPIKQPNTV